MFASFVSSISLVVVWAFESSIRVPQNVYPFQCANGYIENKVIKLLSHWLNHRHTYTFFFFFLYRLHWSRILKLGVWGQNHPFHAQLLTKWGSKDFITVARFYTFLPCFAPCLFAVIQRFRLQKLQSYWQTHNYKPLICWNWMLQPLKSVKTFTPVGKSRVSTFLFKSIIVLSKSFWVNCSAVYAFILGLRVFRAFCKQYAVSMA